jgi:mRNA interferase RelE/StbE
MPMPHKLRVPDEIVSLIRGMHPFLKKRVKYALKEISHDPYCGKSLKEKLTGLRSYRLKRFRIIYKISTNKEISIIALGPRKYIYEETFKIIKKSQQ